MGIREWWAVESIRHVISGAVRLSIWATEILRGKCRMWFHSPSPRARSTAASRGPASVGPRYAQAREELMQRERPLQSPFLFVSLSFLLHLLCTPNNPAQSLLLCPWRLATFSPACLFLACWCSPPPLPLPSRALFIMLLLNILQPIAPKELVCYNMKIWPHLAKVTGNKHLTRGWADGASNSNLLPAPCWFAVLAGVISLPPPSGQPAPEECRAFYFHASALLPSRASDLLILTFSWN